MFISTYMATSIGYKPARVPSRLPAWSRAESLDKLAEAYTVIESLGGRIFTLRLGNDFRQRAQLSADPCRFISRKIRYAFASKGIKVPMHAFFLEVTKDDRRELHLHGAILLDNVPLKTVKELLRSAGGRIDGPAGARQVKIQPFEADRGGPVGWARYPSKTLALTRRTMKHERVIFIEAQLRKQCAEQWEARRKNK